MTSCLTPRGVFAAVALSASSLGSLPVQAAYLGLDGSPHSGPAALRPGARFVHIPTGEGPAPLALAGRSVELSGASAIVGSSSDTIYIAVANGEARVDGLSAGAGQAILLQPMGAAPSVVTFDAERLAALFGPQPPESLRGVVADLMAAADDQSLGIFFGLYERTVLDLQNPGGARVEAARASVMGAPEVVRIRYSGVNDPAQIEAMVVERARAALAARDANALAQLLDPAPYGGDDLGGGGEEARLVVARELTAQYGGPAARNATLRTRPFSDFVFVSSVE